MMGEGCHKGKQTMSFDLEDSPVLANMQLRYSCRDFLLEEVDDEQIEAILSAGQLAPSACNLQPYCFHVIRGQTLARLNAIRSWYDAPVVIIGCYVDKQGWVRDSDQVSFRQFDLALAMGQMALRAQDINLDSCFIGSFKPQSIQQALSLPAEHIPEIALAIGYGVEQYDEEERAFTPRQRKSLQELVTYHN